MTDHLPTEHDTDPSDEPTNSAGSLGCQKNTQDPGYQPDSEECAPNRGYQSGSGESAPNPGYQPGSEEGASIPDLPHLIEGGRGIRRKAQDPGVWLPGADELDLEPMDAADETKFSADSYAGRGNPQVEVRLRPADFERPSSAAHLYGVRPTTLARMMVVRGVRAILEAELERRGELLRGKRSVASER